ncbi:MAG: hypothetical protein R2727_02370 [Bacteroidales bacterium]
MRIMAIFTLNMHIANQWIFCYIVGKIVCKYIVQILSFPGNYIIDAKMPVMTAQAIALLGQVIH